MKQHKWHKEIKAWADGAEIEFREGLTYGWESINKYTIGIFDAQERYEFRIKPQPVEPQYLYVWSTEIGIALTEPQDKVLSGYEYIGKIKLESNDD